MQFSVHGGGGVGGVAGCCAWEIPEKVMPNTANAIHSFRIVAPLNFLNRLSPARLLWVKQSLGWPTRFALVSDFRSWMIV
jgi:hypothetical protein